MDAEGETFPERQGIVDVAQAHEERAGRAWYSQPARPRASRHDERVVGEVLPAGEMHAL
jgi:hypothetical protein